MLRTLFSFLILAVFLGNTSLGWGDVTGKPAPTAPAEPSSDNPEDKRAAAAMAENPENFTPENMATVWNGFSNEERNALLEQLNPTQLRELGNALSPEDRTALAEQLVSKENFDGLLDEIFESQTDASAAAPEELQARVDKEIEALGKVAEDPNASEMDKALAKAQSERLREAVDLRKVRAGLQDQLQAAKARKDSSGPSQTKVYETRIGLNEERIAAFRGKKPEAPATAPSAAAATPTPLTPHGDKGVFGNQKHPIYEVDGRRFKAVPKNYENPKAGFADGVLAVWDPSTKSYTVTAAPPGYVINPKTGEVSKGQADPSAPVATGAIRTSPDTYSLTYKPNEGVGFIYGRVTGGSPQLYQIAPSGEITRISQSGGTVTVSSGGAQPTPVTRNGTTRLMSSALGTTVPVSAPESRTEAAPTSPPPSASPTGSGPTPAPVELTWTPDLFPVKGGSDVCSPDDPNCSAGAGTAKGETPKAAVQSEASAAAQTPPASASPATDADPKKQQAGYYLCCSAANCTWCNKPQDQGGAGLKDVPFGTSFGTAADGTKIQYYKVPDYRQLPEALRRGGWNLPQGVGFPLVMKVLPDGTYDVAATGGGPVGELVGGTPRAHPKR